MHSVPGRSYHYSFLIVVVFQYLLAASRKGCTYIKRALPSTLLGVRVALTDGTIGICVYTVYSPS